MQFNTFCHLCHSKHFVLAATIWTLKHISSLKQSDMLLPIDTPLSDITMHDVRAHKSHMYIALRCNNIIIYVIGGVRRRRRRLVTPNRYLYFIAPIIIRVMCTRLSSFARVIRNFRITRSLARIGTFDCTYSYSRITRAACVCVRVHGIDIKQGARHFHCWH